MAQNYILGLDIGSCAIKAVIAEVKDEKIVRLIGKIIKPSKGIWKGSVVDIEDAVASLRAVFDEAETISKGVSKKIYLGVNGADVKAQISRGIVAVARSNSEIHGDDVNRVNEAMADAIHLGQNRMILHAVPHEYIVDGVSEIQNPVGMIGMRLETVGMVVDGFNPHIQNIIKCIELAGGGDVATGIIFNPLSSALAILSKRQKELGVVLIDMGYHTTNIAVYENGKLLHTKTILFGAGHITNDLAVALKIPVDVAEKVKITYGYAVSADVAIRDKVDLRKFDGNCRGTTTRKFVAEVIEARLEEIFEFINEELKKIHKAGRLPSGAVLVGGGAKLPGIADSCANNLRLSTIIGLPDAQFFETNPETIELIESPEYSTVLGLLLWNRESYQKKPSIKDSTGFLMRVLKSLLP